MEQDSVKIASLSQAVLDSERNANNLLDLVQYLQKDEEVLLEAAIAALSKVYHHFAEQKAMWLLPPSSFKSATTANDSQVVHDYHCWMNDVYNSSKEQLLCILGHPNHNIATLALELLFKMVSWEGHTHQFLYQQYSFPNTLFYEMMSCLLGNTMEGDVLINRCSEFLVYHDVLFYWMRNIASIVGGKLDGKGKVQIPQHLVDNVNCALRLVTMPTKEEELDNFIAGSPPKVQSSNSKKTKSVLKAESVRQLQKYRKQFSDAWLIFLRLPLSSPQLRRVLVELHSSVMPYLLDPRLLLDFLSSAYSAGGVVSLLALNGLFLLMHQYHLDYPQFYNHLYQLLESSIFHVKYTARFFRLLNTFLTSTHLPLYLVAAFAKKLLHLSLSAPPHGVVLAVVMVTNLTKRHLNCRVLLHRTNTYNVTSDPFDPTEPDPAECHALESCFWELKTLKCHYNPAVAQTVERLVDPASLTAVVETSLEQHLQRLEQCKVVDFHGEVGDEVAINYKECMSLWTTQSD